MRFGRGLWWSIAWALVGAACYAGDRIDTTGVDQAATLVRQLGDPSVRVRDQASQALLKLGRAAKPALLAGSRDSDPEIRTRCKQLLPAALWLDLQARISAYVADADGKQAHDLPGLAAFQVIAGNSPAARALFGEILRADPTLVELSESDPKAAAARYQARAQILQQQQLGNLSPSQRNPTSKGDIACLLFVGSQPHVDLTLMAAIPVYTLCQQPPARTAIMSGGPDDPFRKLLLAWIDRRSTDSQTIPQTLNLATNLNLKECLGLAVRSMRDKQIQPYIRAHAITAVAKLGGKERLKDLEEMLTDNKLMANMPFNNMQGTVELRDVALAMCVYLTDQRLQDYGFDTLGQNREMLFLSPYYCGFPDPAKREASFKKWRAWKADPKSATAVAPAAPAKPATPPPPVAVPTPAVPRVAPPK